MSAGGRSVCRHACRHGGRPAWSFCPCPACRVGGRSGGRFVSGRGACGLPPRRGGAVVGGVPRGCSLCRWCALCVAMLASLFASLSCRPVGRSGVAEGGVVVVLSGGERVVFPCRVLSGCCREGSVCGLRGLVLSCRVVCLFVGFVGVLESVSCVVCLVFASLCCVSCCVSCCVVRRGKGVTNMEAPALPMVPTLAVFPRPVGWWGIGGVHVVRFCPCGECGGGCDLPKS